MLRGAHPTVYSSIWGTPLKRDADYNPVAICNEAQYFSSEADNQVLLSEL